MATGRPHYASAALYVGDLHPDVTEPVLYEFFSSVGPVASIRVCRDASSRKSLGYAYVNYHSVGDAERALDTLNFTNIKGIPCRLMWCHRDPSLRRSGNGNLFVKNLDKSLDNKALYDAFSLFGNILSCKVATDEHGKSLGHGFVHFESEEAAQLAIDRVNGVKIGAKEVFVGHFKKRSERISTRDDKFTNLYVKGFPAAWNQKNDITADVTKLFEPFGKITSLMAKQDKRGRYFAFVNFDNGEHARKAIEGLHDKKIDVEGKIIADDQNNVGLTTEIAPPSTTEIAAEAPAVSTNTEEETTNNLKENTDDKGTTELLVPSEEQQQQQPPSKLVDMPSKEETVQAADTATVTWGRLYVQRAQTKVERGQMLRSKFEIATNPDRRKFEGVNLYVKNLSENTDDAGLRALFESFGTVTSAKVMTTNGSSSRGFGFVCFATAEEATQAITAMHNKQIQGKPLFVGLAERREARVARLQQRFRGNPQFGSQSAATLTTAAAAGAGQFGPPPHRPLYQSAAAAAAANTSGHPGVAVVGPTPLMSQQLFFGAGGSHHPHAAAAHHPGGSMLPGWGAGTTAMGGNTQQGGASAGGGLGGGSGPQPFFPPFMKHSNTGAVAPPSNVFDTMGGGGGIIGPQNPSGGGAGPGNIYHRAAALQSGQPGFNNMAAASAAASRMQHYYQPMVGGSGGGAHYGNKAGPGVSGPGRQNLAGGYQHGAGFRPNAHKQMLGERLFPKVHKYQPLLAAKITGMMLEMDDSDLFVLIESEEQLKAKISEALRVLEQAGAITSHTSTANAAALHEGGPISAPMDNQPPALIGGGGGAPSAAAVSIDAPN